MIDLRIASYKDLPIIQLIAEQTWPDTYGDFISGVQLRYMLDKMYAQEELLEQIEHGHTFILAEEAEKPLGFAAFSSLPEKAYTFKLHKLYVLPGMHGKGIGKKLLEEVKKQVAAAQGTSLLLNVNRQNKALEFYQSQGFQIKETVDIEIGNGFFMNDYIMEYVFPPTVPV